MTRQGSAAFSIVMVAGAAILVGAFVLSFVLYPMSDSFTSAAFWEMDTSEGEYLTEAVAGLWQFWGAILLIAILSFVWVVTRQ